jgi:hypothetical protein
MRVNESTKKPYRRVERPLRGSRISLVQRLKEKWRGASSEADAYDCLLKSRSLVESFYLDGYVWLPLKKSEVTTAFLDCVARLSSGPLRPGFEWKEKYAHTRDLRPNVYSYDDLFIDLLVDNDIAQIIRDLHGPTELSHIQLRHSYPGTSYQAWHRDTYIYDGNLVGNLPPVFKLIIYPTFGIQAEERLYVKPGSHRRMYYSGSKDLAQVPIGRTDTIRSSDGHFLLFDTAVLHHVVPECSTEGSIRIIYSFCRESQLDTELERTQSKAYRQRQ